MAAGELDDIRETVKVLVADVADLKTKVALTMQGQEIHQSRVREFIAESARNYDDQNKKLDKLLFESSQWGGARRLFAIAWAGVLGMAAVVGAWATWVQAHAKGVH